MTHEEKLRHRAAQQAEYRRRRKLDPEREALARAKAVARTKKWQQENPEKKRAHSSKTARTTLAKKRAYIAAEKLKSGCVDCGYRDHPAALDFDHVYDNKSFNISQCTSKSFEAVKLEISKCVVRCSNCHRIATHRRLCDKHGLHDALEEIVDHFRSSLTL